MVMRRLSAVLLTIALVAGCSSDDSPTDPGPSAGQARLEVTVPDPITSGRAFEIQVTAFDANGEGPDESFNGDVALSVSSGTVTPATVAVNSGSGSASVVVVSSATTVELSVSGNSSTGTAEVKCAQPGSVLVTSGRAFLIAASEARTFSGGDNNQDLRDVAMPDAMSFSGNLQAESESQHLKPNTVSDFWIAKATSEASMVVTSNLDGSGANLRSINLVASGATTASFNGDVGQGSARGHVQAFVDFRFTVENVPVIADVVGEFEGSFFRVQSLLDGVNVIQTFSEHSAVLNPGEYRCLIRIENVDIATDRTADVANENSMDVTLSFTETPPSE